MNNLILDDDELQEYRIKEFLFKYLGKIIFGAVVLVTIFGGYKYYKHLQYEKIVKASTAYEVLLQAQRDNDSEKVEKVANYLIKEYQDTVYSSFAGLFQAKVYVEKGEFEKAENALSNIVVNSSDNTLVYIAKLRLAKVLFMQDKHYDARQILIEDSDGYTPLYKELLGDIYASEKNYKEAKKAYSDALSLTPQGLNKPFWIEAKLSKLPEA